jgi:ABC-2 type transport system ATP-binding protein
VDAFVEINGLRKVYRRFRLRASDDSEDPATSGAVVAIEGLDLTRGAPGTVHGFLGPNRSGKTTTNRCALGLNRPTNGNEHVFGPDTSTGFHRVASRVGAIVESPKMFPNFSGRRNLSLLADIAGIDHREVDRVLEIVSLKGRGNDRFGSYSLGMRQRLAIAGAMLKDPDLLILDEPANGLDPAGIAEMRRLIRQIAEQGKAVVVSSHQLAEMEQVCDQVTIINRGKLVETGSLDKIRSFAGQDRVVVTIDEREGAIAALNEAGIPAHPRPNPRELTVDIEADRASDVTRVLASAGRFLSGLHSESPTLEHAFLNLTGDTPPPPVVAAPAPAPDAAVAGDPPSTPAPPPAPAAPPAPTLTEES